MGAGAATGWVSFAGVELFSLALWFEAAFDADSEDSAGAELLAGLDFSVDVGALAATTFPGFTGLASMVPSRPPKRGRWGNCSTGMSSVICDMNIRQTAAAVELAPEVGVLSSFPSQTPVASWGM